MFQLTLVDHLRMTFGHIVYQHRAHAQIAYSRARWNRGLKAFEALLMTGVAVTALGAAFGRGYAYEFGSAILAILAVICLILHVAFDLDGTAQAHAACATRLWYIRERYQALMSDLSDGAVDVQTVRRMRDDLAAELRGVYESSPPADPQAYQTAAQAIATDDERSLTDEEIDRFLPKSMRAVGHSEPADARAG
jgi:SMODS and SLOG-associating 2TM effector domain family 4